nr:putative ribonuclease H-like domain-containing protein [Tanacetum cinerariifolium]
MIEVSTVEIEVSTANAILVLLKVIQETAKARFLGCKFISRGCQLLGCRLISWQCKKQIVVATSTTEAEYVAAASCCGQLLWSQNQLLDYGLTFADEAHHIWLSLILEKKMIKYELSNGLEIKLNTRVDGQVKTIIEASIRRHIKLADADGISTLPTTEVFKQLMGYVTDSDKLTFQKGHFSPQWRFLIHTIIYCLSPKKTSWEQFSSNIVIAIICLATNRRFYFSKLIFNGMVKNLKNKYKFLMYLRFLQMILNKDTRLDTPQKRLFIAPSLTQKVFSNMKRESRGFFEVETALFPTMLVTEQVSQGEGPKSPVGTQHTPAIIESSPHLQNISITYRKTNTRIGRMGIRIPQSNVSSSVVDEAITKEMHDGLGRATNTTSSLVAKQGSGGLGFHFTTGDSPVQPRLERLSNLPNEPPLEEGNTSRSSDGAVSPQIDDDDDETLAQTLLNIKRNAAKDKGKAIMQESESPKKIKKKEMMQISLDEEIAQIFYEEEQALILRDEEKKERVYLLKKGLFQWKVKAKQQTLKQEKEAQKQVKSLKRSTKEELGPKQKVEEEIVQQEDVVAKQAEKESSKKVGGRLKRKTLKAREDKDKRQKKQDDLEKLTLMEYVEVISDSKEADRSYKTYIFFSEMLNGFDKEDLIVLYRLVNEKYASTRPGFDDLMLWGDMKIMFEPNGDDEV